jgi:hypothetical protein
MFYIEFNFGPLTAGVVTRIIVSMVAQSPAARSSWRAENSGVAVHPEYDIFKVCPDGDLLWRLCVAGLENARLKAAELGKQSSNPFFAARSHIRNRCTSKS